MGKCSNRQRTNGARHTTSNDQASIIGGDAEVLKRGGSQKLGDTPKKASTRQGVKVSSGPQSGPVPFRGWMAPRPWRGLATMPVCHLARASGRKMILSAQIVLAVTPVSPREMSSMSAKASVPSLLEPLSEPPQPRTRNACGLNIAGPTTTGSPCWTPRWSKAIVRASPVFTRENFFAGLAHRLGHRKRHK